MADVLSILVVEKDQENYEQNYSVVWLQLYQSLAYLDIESLSKKQVFTELASKFYSLNSILQESFYPKLHHKSEKMI